MSNVKLAIRLRPFTDSSLTREVAGCGRLEILKVKVKIVYSKELRSDKDRIPVVSVVDERTVAITNIKVSVSGAGDSRERVRRYSADYTFDSACPDNHPAYASQEKVFDSIGREVVASVRQGSSACVLTYGQSATGKTHTMMGTTDQPGLVPRLCRAFAEDALDVTVSFLEIYNEKVHDLLAGEPLACHSLPRRRGNARKDLRVREHPERGPYVQNLRRVAVTDLNTLLSLVEEGARRRQTAATKRNSTSSRSHALLELATPKATLHLADLAGSEKASWEGCGGGRQKEGANINKSLVALSNVISALVSGGNRGRFVPYRDSALTWLLKDCFTGGASTFIIATVSPSVACYGESASTLRWAERARQLRTSKLPTSGPSTASRAALQAQLSQLLAELAKQYINYNLQTGKIAYEENHWNLQPENKNVQLKEDVEPDANIGNILNMFNPKTDHNSQNSESTASSVASGSSDVINTMDKNINIKEEINKEVDKLLAPAFERTRSGSDFEAIAPLRHKKRQYKSQEVLPIDKTLSISQSTAQPTPSQSQEHISGLPKDSSKPHIPILYDNQRAEIVASVTERLYSKLKKKEEAVVSKVENVVDKKIVEPLSELKICTNARQRLMEMSQKAMRHKGRRIGIPAFTQTRYMVTRVRDQSIDVQSDLESYIIKRDHSCMLQKDVATETVPITPRCKEVAAGPKHSSLNFLDKGTVTESKQVVHKNSFMMTDIVNKSDRYSQTPVVPPRRKRRAKQINCNESHKCCSEEFSVPSIVSINISQTYSIESESQSSEDNLEFQSSDDSITDGISYNKPTNVSTTPDLLTNHNNIDTSIHEKSCVLDNPLLLKTNNSNSENNKIVNVGSNALSTVIHNCETIEFPDDCPDEISLPRVTIASAKITNQEDMKDMILGRNENLYPYNIVLSPPREGGKRIVKFEDDDDAVTAVSIASQTSWEWSCDGMHSKCSSVTTQPEKDSKVIHCDTREELVATVSDTTDSNKAESNSFIFKRCDNKVDLNQSISKGYTPVHKNNVQKYRNARTKMYKEFLGLENHSNGNHKSINAIDTNSSESTENEEAQSNFKKRRQFFEENIRRSSDPCRRFDLIDKRILDSCNSLDASVNRYEDYLTKFYNRRHTSIGPLRSPKEYLQHLVQIRREVVRNECNTMDSSKRLSRKQMF